MDKSVPVAEQADELIEIFGQSDNYYAQLLDHYESQTDVYIVYKIKSSYSDITVHSGYYKLHNDCKSMVCTTEKRFCNHENGWNNR